MVLIKDYNKRTFAITGATQVMFAKLTELGGKVENLILEGKRAAYWTFPMRKKNSLIDYFIISDIDYKND